MSLENGRTISEGYMITVDSWENDGDHYATKELQGLSEEDVKFAIALCEYFKRWGNEILDWETVNKDMNEIIQHHPCVTTGTLGAIIMNVDDEDEFADYIYELIGHPVDDYGAYGDGARFYRTIDGYKVFHTPVDIYLENVTSQFKGE